MDVLIRLKGNEPPTGTVLLLAADERTTDKRAGVPFVGWLGLLRALAMLVGQGGRPPDR